MLQLRNINKIHYFHFGSFCQTRLIRSIFHLPRGLVVPPKILAATNSMTSQGIPSTSMIDIESRLQTALDKSSSSLSLSSDAVKCNKIKRSLPKVNWDSYCKTGNKASFAWLMCLFSLLGVLGQQASLSSIAVQTTTVSSTLDYNSSFQPPVARSSPAEATRSMMEVSVESANDAQNTAVSASNDENTNQQSNELPQQNESSLQMPVNATSDSTVSTSSELVIENSR